MSAGTNDDAKKLTYWQDGMPSVDLQSPSTELHKVSYWVDGMPYVTIYPSEDQRISDFMPFFWGIG